MFLLSFKSWVVNLSLFVPSFPAGAMTREEYDEYQAVKSDHLKYWIPLVWFSNLLAKAKMEGRILSDITYNHILKVSLI